MQNSTMLRRCLKRNFRPIKMQYYQDLCLKTALVKNLFIDGKYKIFTMKKKLLHRSEDYNDETAAFLLRISIHTTQCTFLNIDPLYDDWDYYPFYNKKFVDENYNKKGIIGYILKKEKICIIVFTGTNNVSLASADLDYKQKKCDSFSDGYMCHGGFAKIFNDVVEQIKDKIDYKSELYITGHSMGGGLSNICALYFKKYKPIHYSFASPMIFGEKMAYEYNKHIKHGYRIYNMYDVVSMSPLPIMPNGDSFYHVGEPIQFGDNGGKYSYNHTESYIRAFNLYVDYYIYNNK